MKLRNAWRVLTETTPKAPPVTPKHKRIVLASRSKEHLNEQELLFSDFYAANIDVIGDSRQTAMATADYFGISYKVAFLWLKKAKIQGRIKYRKALLDASKEFPTDISSLIIDPTAREALAKLLGTQPRILPAEDHPGDGA